MKRGLLCIFLLFLFFLPMSGPMTGCSGGGGVSGGNGGGIDNGGKGGGDDGGGGTIPLPKDPEIIATAEDTDKDGIIDSLDNCPLVVNTGQEDFDGDNIGDACDPEDDSVASWSWTRLQGESDNQSYEIIEDIAVHSATGAVYSVGTVGPRLGAPSRNTDILLTKYDVEGNLLWSSRHQAPLRQEGQSITLDADGNIYVTGFFYGEGENGEGLDGQRAFGGYDLVILKFDKEGKHLWTRQWGDHSQDMGYGIAVDEEKNIIVVGGTADAEGILHSCLLKFDTSGNLIWAKRFGTGAEEESYSVALDAEGNIVAAGTVFNDSEEGGTFDYLVRKFDEDGNMLWEKTRGSLSDDDTAYAVALDPSGNVYVAGESYLEEGESLDGQPGFGFTDIVVLKYDSEGEHLWTRIHGTPETEEDPGSDEVRGLAVDYLGNVYVAGMSTGRLDGQEKNGGPGDYDVVLLKFDTNGNHRGTYQRGSDKTDEAWGVTVDGNGKIYVGGMSHGNFDGQNQNGNGDLLIIKYSQGAALPPSADALP